MHIIMIEMYRICNDPEHSLCFWKCGVENRFFIFFIYQVEKDEDIGSQINNLF